MVASTVVPSPGTYSRLCQVALDLLKQALLQPAPLQQVAEVQYRALIGNGLLQTQHSKAPHRLRLVQEILHGGLGESLP